MLLNLFIFFIPSILTLPQAHGTPNLLFIALNQISSQGLFTFHHLEELLINTLSHQSNLLLDHNRRLTFLAPTDDAFDNYLSKRNISLQSFASANESVFLMECRQQPVTFTHLTSFLNVDMHISSFTLFKEIQLNGFTPFSTRYEESEVKMGRDQNGTISIQSGLETNSIVLQTYSLESVKIFVVDRVPQLPFTNLTLTLLQFNATRSLASILWSAVEYHSIANFSLNQTRYHTL
jgi:uncharacterized surface protein with fasciclin (FAS1) repeats